MSRTPTCVWRCTPELVVALASRFGPPVDAYVNGSQVWLRDDGPAGATLEWRLHPVAGYQRPPGLGTHDVFEAVADAAAGHGEVSAAPGELWDGLEAFCAYGDEVEPQGLATATTEALGLAPDGCGLVDHQRLGDAWERSGGRVSLVEAILTELGGRPDPSAGS